MSILSPFVIFHGGLELLYRCSFPLKIVPGCSQSHCWLLALFVDFVPPFPPPINNPPNWEHARFSVKQSVLVPLSSMPGQSEGEGRWTELCSCPANKMKHFRGRREGPGCTLNQPLSSARKILRATEHPVVGYPHQQITHVCRSVRPGWGGKKKNQPRYSHPPFLQSAADSEQSKADCMSSRQSTQHAAAVWLGAESGSAF